MKVSKLKKILKNYPDDFIVVLSKDGEGNDFSPLDDDSSGIYVAESTWSGRQIHPDDAQNGQVENALFLWPVN